MRIAYKDIVLRDMVASDVEDEIRWYTTEMAWAHWDAPWESLEEVRKFDEAACRRREAERLAQKKPEVRNALELESDGVHLGGVASYFIDEAFDWIPGKDVKQGQIVYRTLGLDICESSHWGRGVGTQALTAWCLYFLGNGETNLHLQTWSGNERMLRCARKLGFREVNREPALREVQGQHYDGLTLRLDETLFWRFLLWENCRELQLPSHTVQAILNAYDSRPAFYRQKGERAYDGDAPNFLICKRSPLERLVIWCCHMTRVRQRYQQKGIPYSVVRNTFSDIALRSRLYEEKQKKPGLSKEDTVWFRHIHDCQIFQLGALQYQLFHMVYLDKEGCGSDYMSFSAEQKQQLPPGSPVLNLHIPTGADLSPASVAWSLQEARAFFGRYFPDHGAKAIVCYSWLLYPDLRLILPECSNIASFAARFQILGQAQGAYASDAVRRIYGRRYARISDYSQSTTLQRNALGHFRFLGEACGIIMEKFS